MRVWVIFLLFFAISLAVAYEPRKTAKTDNVVKKSEDSSDKDEPLPELDEKEGEEEIEREDKEKKEKKKTAKAPKQKEEEEDEEESKPKTKGSKSKPRERQPEEEEDDEKEDSVEYVCDVKTDMCLCQSNVLDCHGEIDDSVKLATTYLIVNKKLKDFKILTADFSQNKIRHLRKKQLLPDREEDVVKIDFEHNFISRIEAGVFDPFKRLGILNLGYNRLSRLVKDQLSGLSGLHTLDLHHNRLTKLENGTFKDLRNLKKLVLDGNKIPIRKELFEGLDMLEELSLDDCGITVESLDLNVFDNLPKLRALSMRKNPLQEVPKALENLENLQYLDLSETKIPELHQKSFHDDSKLKTFIMENSLVFSIQERAFCGLTSLEEVKMSNNKQLLEVHPDAFGMSSGTEGKVTSIQTINFANCNISILTADTFYMESLKELSLGGNPWSCDCNTYFLLGDPLEDFVFKEPYPVCDSPKELKGKQFTRVQPIEACSKLKKTRVVFRGVKVLAILLLLTVLCIASFMVYNKGYIQNFLKTARNGAPAFPSMTYSNLNNTTDDGRTLETDFQPRPEDV